MSNKNSFTEDSLRVYAKFFKIHEANNSIKTIEEISITPDEILLKHGVSVFKGYVEMHNQSLIESLRQFNYDISSLHAWQIALDEMSFEEKSLALLNHLDSLIPRIVGFPYMLKEQYCLSVCLLSKIASSIQSDLEIADEIKKILDCRNRKYDLAVKLVINSTEWTMFNADLRKLDDKAFRKNTGDLRNNLHHSYTRNMIVGLTSRVTVRKNGFAFGVDQPIQISELINAVAQQLDIAIDTYKTFSAYAKHLWLSIYSDKES